jgi:hypothetical protein
MGDILLITYGDILVNVLLNGGKSILRYVLMYNKPLYLIMIVSSRIKYLHYDLFCKGISLHYDLRYVPLITT